MVLNGAKTWGASSQTLCRAACAQHMLSPLYLHSALSFSHSAKLARQRILPRRAVRYSWLPGCTADRRPSYADRASSHLAGSVVNGHACVCVCARVCACILIRVECLCCRKRTRNSHTVLQSWHQPTAQSGWLAELECNPHDLAFVITLSLPASSSHCSHLHSFSYHPSFKSMARCFCAYAKTPTAASGCRSWLLIWMSASIADAGDAENSSSL